MWKNPVRGQEKNSLSMKNLFSPLSGNPNPRKVIETAISFMIRMVHIRWVTKAAEPPLQHTGRLFERLSDIGI
jgi:hypothetical protein